MAIYHFIEPYTDQLMRWDEETHRYYLTEQGLIENGIDLRAKIAENKGVNAENLINRYLRTITNTIYGYIYKHNFDNIAQEKIIAHNENARKVIYRALCEQAIYMSALGDLVLTTDKNKKEQTVSQHAIDELMITIAPYGVPILYQGVWMRGYY